MKHRRVFDLYDTRNTGTKHSKPPETNRNHLFIIQPAICRCHTFLILVKNLTIIAANPVAIVINLVNMISHGSKDQRHFVGFTRNTEREIVKPSRTKGIAPERAITTADRR